MALAAEADGASQLLDLMAHRNAEFTAHRQKGKGEWWAGEMKMPLKHAHRLGDDAGGDGRSVLVIDRADPRVR
jgi:hypothetical protein